MPIGRRRKILSYFFNYRTILQAGAMHADAASIIFFSIFAPDLYTPFILASCKKLKGAIYRQQILNTNA
jgi:hypothetical protein